MAGFSRIIFSFFMIFSSTWLSAAAAAPELGGYCPVSYIANHKAVKGDEKFSSTYEGKTYYLTNAKAKDIFDKSPGSFIDGIAYGAWSTNDLVDAKKEKSDPMLFSIHEKKFYFFSNKAGKDSFDKMPAPTIKKANDGWAKVTASAK